MSTHMFLWRTKENYPLSSNTFLICSTVYVCGQGVVIKRKWYPHILTFISNRLLQMTMSKVKHYKWSRHSKILKNEPAHEIMALFVPSKLILQTRMRSHPVGLDVWLLVWPFVYFHSSCVQTAKALARLRGYAGSPELVCDKYHNLVSWLKFETWHRYTSIFCQWKKTSINSESLCQHLKRLRFCLSLYKLDCVDILEGLGFHSTDVERCLYAKVQINLNISAKIMTISG